MNAGLLFYHQGYVANAFSAFEFASRVEPESFEPIRHIALLHEALGEAEKAVHILLSASNASFGCMAVRDAIHLALKRHATERFVLPSAGALVANCPAFATDGAIFSAVASLFQTRGAARTALRAHITAVRLNSTSADGWNNFCLFARNVLMWRHVRRCFDIALRKAARMTWFILYNFANAFNNNDLEADALAIFDRAVQIAPSDSARLCVASNAVYMARMTFNTSYIRSQQPFVDSMAFRTLPPPAELDGPPPLDPYMALFLSTDPALHLHAARVLSEMMASRAALLCPDGCGIAHVQARGGGVVRVGYVSTEFGNTHSLMLLMRRVFEGHNRLKFHVSCYGLYGIGATGPSLRCDATHSLANLDDSAVTASNRS